MKANALISFGGCTKKPHGFTLIESLVVIAILGILVAAAAPNFSSTITNMRMKSTSFDLTNDLNTARSEAIKRNSNVILSANSEDWNQGWSIVTGGITLRTHDAIGTNIEITSSANSITFQSNGRPDSTINLSISSTLSGTTSRCIELQATGSARSTKGAC